MNKKFMKHKLMSCILIIMFLFISVNVNADIDEYIDLDKFDYVIHARYFGSSGEETEKFYPVNYLTDVGRIYSVSISSIGIGGVLGKEANGKGALCLYDTVTSQKLTAITPIPTYNMDVDKYNQNTNKELETYIANGLMRCIVSLRATEGRIWFKYVIGTVNGRDYIIIFDESR